MSEKASKTYKQRAYSHSHPERPGAATRWHDSMPPPAKPGTMPNPHFGISFWLWYVHRLKDCEEASHTGIQDKGQVACYS